MPRLDSRSGSLVKGVDFGRGGGSGCGDWMLLATTLLCAGILGGQPLGDPSGYDRQYMRSRLSLSLSLTVSSQPRQQMPSFLGAAETKHG